MRGLIIGTSHAAALRLAWRDHGPDWPDQDLTFAALQGDVAELQVTGPHLTAATDEARQKLRQFSGQDSFDLTAYDWVALCGGTSSGFHAIRTYNAARCVALPSSRRLLPPEVSLISTRCFLAALTAQIRTASAHPLLTAIAAATPARLFAIPHPGLSQDALRGSKHHLGFARMHQMGDAPALSALLDQAGHAAYDGLAQFLPAPSAVRHDQFFTGSRFRRGATRLGAEDTVPQPSDDFLHGNADYGHHILTALFGAMSRQVTHTAQ